VFVAFIKLIQCGELESRMTMAGFLLSFSGGIRLRRVVRRPCWPRGKSRVHYGEGREETGAGVNREEEIKPGRDDNIRKL